MSCACQCVNAIAAGGSNRYGAARQACAQAYAVVASQCVRREQRGRGEKVGAGFAERTQERLDAWGVFCRRLSIV